MKVAEAQKILHQAQYDEALRVTDVILELTGGIVRKEEFRGSYNQAHSLAITSYKLAYDMDMTFNGKG